jgi:hypothetical protein
MSRIILLALVAYSQVLSTSGRAQTVQGALVNEQSHQAIWKAQIALLDDSGHVGGRDFRMQCVRPDGLGSHVSRSSSIQRVTPTYIPFG